MAGKVRQVALAASQAVEHHFSSFHGANSLRPCDSHRAVSTGRFHKSFQFSPKGFGSTDFQGRLLQVPPQEIFRPLRCLDPSGSIQEVTWIVIRVKSYLKSTAIDKVEADVMSWRKDPYLA